MRGKLIGSLAVAVLAVGAFGGYAYYKHKPTADVVASEAPADRTAGKPAAPGQDGQRGGFTLDLGDGEGASGTDAAPSIDKPNRTTADEAQPVTP